MVQVHKTRSVINPHMRLSWRLGLLALFLVAPAYSQSLGDIAREERERKQDQPHRPTHVYDNDDLARPQILLPEDQERAHAAKKKTAPASSDTPAEAAGGDQKMEATPLSDVGLRSRALNTDPQELKPLPSPQQPLLGAPSLGPAALSPPPVRPAVQPVKQVEHIGKAIPREEIAGSEKPAGDRRVRVQPGDTLWKIAYKYLGQGKDWQVLVDRNPLVTDPLRLKVGTWVRLPDETPDLPPPESVRIKPGDTLWKLTQTHLGDGRDWNCVAQANPQLHSGYLIFPGQILKFPESCSAASSRVRLPKVSPESSPSSSAQLLQQAH